MAVRLLAGPFPLVDWKTNTPLTYVLSDWVWYPGVGLLVPGIVDPDYEDYQIIYIASLDGIVAKSTRFYGIWSWWPHRKRMLLMDYFSGKETVFEPVVMSHQHTAPEDQLTRETAVTRRYVKLLDRRIYIGSGRLFSQVGGSTPVVEFENENFPLSADDIYPGRYETDVFVAGRSGLGNSNAPYYLTDSGCFYDTVTQQVVSPRYTISIPTDFLLYVPEYGVLLSGERASAPDASRIWIWSLEVEPTTLTPPVPIIGTPKSGQVVTFQVRLTGDHNDGAEGELVDWSLSGAGALTDVQSKTDKDGYAITRVQYDLGETGTTVLEASVTC